MVIDFLIFSARNEINHFFVLAIFLARIEFSKLFLIEKSSQQYFCSKIDNKEKIISDCVTSPKKSPHQCVILPKSATLPKKRHFARKRFLSFLGETTFFAVVTFLTKRRFFGEDSHTWRSNAYLANWRVCSFCLLLRTNL